MIALPQPLISTIDVIGWALLHFLWQGTVLGLLYVVLRPFCNGVAARYRLGLGTLLLMALCPCVTILLLLRASGQVDSSAAISLPAITAAISSIAEHRIPGWHFEQALPWLVALWFVGVSVIGSRAFLHWRRLSRLVRHAAAPLAEYQASLEKLCRRFGVLRPIRLLASSLVGTPMLLGWLKPVILLPASMFSGFTPEQIELIIAHELGHVRRGDYLCNLVQVVIETILFYHPAVHWISRDVRDARENCCDDLVLTVAGGSPTVYARALANLEELRLDMHLASPALAASGGVLLARIRRIVGVQHALYDPLPRTSAWPILLGLIGAIFMLLRLNHTQPQPLATALLHMPAQTIALISGNQRLSDVAATATVAPAPAVPAVTALQASIVRSSTSRSAPVDTMPAIPVPRPRISVAPALSAQPQVANIHASLTALAELSLPQRVPLAEAATPIPVHLAQPVYPQREKTQGITGKVELQFRITDDGGVRDIRVLHSTSVVALEQAAIAALKQWRFSAPTDTDRVYSQSFAFAQEAIWAPGRACHEVTGSHICRRMATEDGLE